uniref:Uncharacterized protein n=1 Tax=Cannabis sativa TaxID=3483 RepID=A0A803R0U2_CANSA
MRGVEVRRSEESLCEMSLKVVANIIRLSAFSISQRSLGNNTNNNTNNNNDDDHHPVVVVAPSSSYRNNNFIKTKTKTKISTSPPSPPLKVNKPLLRALKPQCEPQQIYLVDHEPITRHLDHNLDLVKEDMNNVDGRASDFIQKVRQKNLKAVTNNNETIYSCKLVPRSRTM